MQIWYHHAYKVNVMAQVVDDLSCCLLIRSCLQLLNIAFDNYEQVGRIFSVGFEQSYTAATNMQHHTAAFGPPAHHGHGAPSVD